MKTLRPTQIATAIALGGTLVSVPAQGQEAWPFISFEVFRYDSLVNTDEDMGLPCCLPHVVGNPGQVLIHVSAVIDVPWSEELERVSVSARELTLTLPGEEPATSIGHYDRVGIFEAGTTSISASRPRDWPESDEHLKMETVWSLPTDATTATLTLGEFFAVEIDVPQEVSEPLTPADTADFVITGMSAVEGPLATSSSFSGQVLTGTVETGAGQFVRVDFDVIPQMNTSLSRRDGFLLYTRYMQLVGPTGLPALPVGQYLGDGITRDTSNSISGNSFIGSSFDYSFYYLTDGTPGTYTLYFLSDPVGEGTL